MIEWRDIPSFPDYEASSDGRVRRKEPSVRLPPDRCPLIRIIKGYKRITIFRGGKGLTRTIGTLVCEAFHGPRPKGKQCAHRNGDPLNNRPRNVRWATPQENIDDREMHGRTSRGDVHYASVLSSADVKAIRARASKELTGRRIPMAFREEIASKYGISISHVGNVINRRKWRHVT